MSFPNAVPSATGGQCIDASYNRLMDVISEGADLYNGFYNPQASVIEQIRIAGYGRIDAITAIVDDPVLWPLINGDQQTAILTLRERMIELCGTPGSSDTVLDHLLAHTNFLSGKSHKFPMTKLLPYVDGIKESHLLAGLTFVGLLGIARGGVQIDNALCSTTNPPDPDDPCKTLNKIFGAIFEAFNFILAAIANGLAAMNDFINLAAQYLNQLLGYIHQIVQVILDALQTLVGAIIKAIRFALAKLLGNSMLDPCLSLIIQKVGSAVLLEAIAEVEF